MREPSQVSFVEEKESLKHELRGIPISEYLKGYHTGKQVTHVLFGPKK